MFCSINNHQNCPSAYISQQNRCRRDFLQFAPFRRLHGRHTFHAAYRVTVSASEKHNGMQAREALRGNVPTQSQAGPDMSFDMSGLVSLGLLTNDRASNSSLALDTHITSVRGFDLLDTGTLLVGRCHVANVSIHRCCRCRRTQCSSFGPRDVTLFPVGKNKHVGSEA
jgi:hypothetical protein